jgi:hypothetical protein
MLLITNDYQTRRTDEDKAFTEFVAALNLVCMKNFKSVLMVR